MFTGGLEEAEDWVRSWSSLASERAAAAQRLADRTARVTATGTDADRLVSVTVAGTGIPTALRLDERVRELNADRIAARILDAMHEAQAALAAEVARIAAETVGPDSETARAVTASFATRFPAGRSRSAVEERR